MHEELRKSRCAVIVIDDVPSQANVTRLVNDRRTSVALARYVQGARLDLGVLRSVGIGAEW
ncbi:MAG: hypothetical protein ACKVP4_09820 [Hyphomicrobium sp.]